MMLPCSRRKAWLGEFGDEDLFRRVAHRGGRIHHIGLGVDALEDVGERDVVHVEGRVLPHQHHVVGREIGAAELPEPVVLALRLVEDLDRRQLGRYRVVAQGKGVRRVIGYRVAAGLRLEHQREGRIAQGVDRGDGVHLDRDAELHRYLTMHQRRPSDAVATHGAQGKSRQSATASRRGPGGASGSTGRRAPVGGD